MAGNCSTVLKENDIEAYGIEILDSAVEECVAAGLDARVDDALHHLASVPKASLGAVTAIHVVEHLGMDTLIEMIDLSLRALKPGGMIIFETPNPANVMVGADSFYIDPTHDHPIPSALLEFLVSIRGFTDAQVVPLKRAPNLFTNVMPDRGSLGQRRLACRPARRQRIPRGRGLRRGRATSGLVMRVAVWTPLPPEPSGIADYNAQLLAYMARDPRVELTAIVRDEVVETARAPRGVSPVRRQRLLGG